MPDETANAKPAAREYLPVALLAEVAAAVGGRGQGRAAHRRRCGSFRRALRAEALRRAEPRRPVAR